MRELLGKILVVGLLFSCTPKESVVRFHVDARTNQGEPVNDAMVVVDGQIIGKTSNKGAFSGELKLPVASKKKLEIRKDSDTHYFAPYVQTFDVSTMSPQEVTVAAVLYFVPKPSPDSARSVETSSSPNAVHANELTSIQATTDSQASNYQSAVNEAPSTPTTDGGQTFAGSQVSPNLTNADANLPSVSPRAGDSDTKEAKSEEQIAEPQAKEQLEAEHEAQDEGEKTDHGESIPQPISKVFTVHVVAGTTPLSGVDVAIGEEESSQLRPGCTTNQRGRCVIRFNLRADTPITFVASKKGFKTYTVVVPIKSKDKLRISLEQGRTLDIYAVTESYGHVYGLEDVEVYVRGKKIGATDKFGRYSHVFSSKSDELVAVGLKPQSFIPENFETDFVASDQMTLVKYFAQLEPPAARLAVLPLAAAGNLDGDSLNRINGEVAKVVDSAARKMFFSSMAFKEISSEFFLKKIKAAGKDIRAVSRQGWRDTDLKAGVDAAVLPTVVMGPKPTLELSVIDNSGRVLAAAKESLTGLDDLNAIDRAIGALTQRIDRIFPFEGAVLKKDGDKVEINLGQTQGVGLKPGDQLDLYGLQSEKSGRSQMHSKIATLIVRAVKDDSASCIISGLAARATVGRGDLVRLKSRKTNEARPAELRVSSVSVKGEQFVAQANVYLGETWMGATDDSGRIPLPAVGDGQLKVIKIGFADFNKAVDFSKQRQIKIELVRQQAFLKIASKPSGGTVKIDGAIVGTTPIAAPIPVHSGFVKIEIEGVNGYKPYSSVLELDQGTLELIGDEAIALEPDLRSVAQELLKAGKPIDAVEKLNEVTSTHSDYLFARHEAGEIYLNYLDQPAKAAASFGIVTASESVRQFNDKRFVASHINEGIALFATAEKLAVVNPEAARAHYQKASEVLDKVVPFLRFVSVKDHDQAVHNVDYHRALCRHRLWTATQDPKLLVETVRGWRNYLDGSARTIPVTEGSKSYIGNAEVYLKQASAQLNGARSTLRQ